MIPSIKKEAFLITSKPTSNRISCTKNFNDRFFTNFLLNNSKKTHRWDLVALTPFVSYMPLNSRHRVVYISEVRDGHQSRRARAPAHVVKRPLDIDLTTHKLEISLSLSLPFSRPISLFPGHAHWHFRVDKYYLAPLHTWLVASNQIFHQGNFLLKHFVIRQRQIIDREQPIRL